MAKSGKVRNRVTSRNNGVTLETQTSIAAEERLRRIENEGTGNTSQVFKFAFFFLMGVALTVILYPEISRAIGSTTHGHDVQEKTTGVSSTRNDTHGEQFSELDNEEFENIDISSQHSNDIILTNDIPKANEDELVEETNDEDSEKSKPVERLILREIDSKDLMIDEESNVDETVQERISNDDDAEPERRKRREVNKKLSKSINLEKENVEAKIEAKQKKIKSNKKTKQNVNDDTTLQESDKKLPKEITDFKSTILKGVTAKKIFADGRRIPPIELLPQKPNNSSVRVWMFEEFLSDAECEGLIKVHNQHVTEQNKLHPILCFDSVSTLRKHLRRVGKKTLVTPRDFTPGTTCVNTTFSRQLREWLHGNWSYSTAFYSGESRFASVFEHRVKEATGLTPANGGKFQITSYPQGIGYKSHTDCTESKDKRDRVATVMVYLDTVQDGGRTEFPELGIWVKPRKGRAMVWNNMNENGDCEPMSIHKAAKVESGSKHILIRWYYYQSFYSLGKRPPEPDLPLRESGQPRVACDEYEHGSCRWYDEWNFDHLIEYERQKYTLV